jgi:Carboxypeptidase regulatory-like domain/Bacterial Ig domain
LSKKTLAVGIVFLFIFSVGNSFVVGYDAELDENLSEGNCLTECLNEHGESTRQIYGKNCGSAAVMDDLLEFYKSFDLYSHLMKTTGDPDDGEHDGYAKTVYDDVENSTICGYILDNTTEEPIEDARVNIFWSGHQGIIVNYTYSNTLGFYSIDIEMSEVLLVVRASGYFSQFMEINDFEDNETVWYNVSLNPGAPLENSIVCGYITDNLTDKPIDGADVICVNYANSTPYDWNYTFTNSSGFYRINVSTVGDAYFYSDADGYYSNATMEYTISENETLWLNISLDPRRPENSTVCGYITDNITKEPIKNACVDLYWSDDQGHFVFNYTHTDSSGFYSMNVAAGKIWVCTAFADGYFSESIWEYNISENEALWINISLYPIPPENSTVCGYITNELTEEPIKNARFHFYWEDNQGHFYSNDTYTNSSGFYSMNVAAGEISGINVYADGYYSKYEGSYDIDENETLWINASLYPIPPKNSIICGYVTDETTGAPIENASVDLDWNDDQGHNVWDYTSTDSSGFYSMNVASGEINIDVEADEYLEVHTESYDIGEYESLEINITMQFIINENSVVCGYITDVETDYPIIDAYVSLHWHDDRGHFYWKYTFADSSGFYEMNVASGEVCIHAYAYEYLCKYTEDYEIGEYDTLWVNVPMQCEVIEVNIVKPQKALYVANYRVLPLLFKSIIYGSIDIEVGASDDTSFVEFRVDGKIRATDDSEPYTWTWDTRTLLKHRHIIEIVAYGRFGSSATDEITVWKFF